MVESGAEESTAMNPQSNIKVNGKEVDRAAFREGFVTGWVECYKHAEPDKVKLKQIAEAAADNFISAL
jgi:hypothetical protein